VREIERARFSLQLAEDRVQIALRRQEEQEIKADEITAQALVDTENVLDSARRARNQAKTDVRNAVLDYLIATGTLRVRRDGTFQPLPGMEAAPGPELSPDAPPLLPPAMP
jgi:outer membrane protein TolC